MPLLILLGIGAIYGAASFVDRNTKSSKKYDINISDEEKLRRVFEANNKRIDKIMRKYR